MNWRIFVSLTSHGNYGLTMELWFNNGPGDVTS